MDTLYYIGFKEYTTKTDLHLYTKSSIKAFNIDSSIINDVKEDPEAKEADAVFIELNGSSLNTLVVNKMITFIFDEKRISDIESYQTISFNSKIIPRAGVNSPLSYINKDNVRVYNNFDTIVLKNYVSNEYDLLLPEPILQCKRLILINPVINHELPIKENTEVIIIN